MVALKFNPYTYVRTKVMGSFLLKKDDYEKLMKMGPSEIINFLQNKEYKEFAELSLKHFGIELFEMALKNNIIKTYEKLKKISDKELHEVLENYLMRYDVFNFKTVLRGIFTNQPKEEINELIIPVGFYKRKYYEELVEKRNPAEVFAKLSLTVLHKYLDQQLFGKKALANLTLANLANIETALDKAYFKYLLEYFSSVGREGEMLTNFVKTEILNINFLTLLRLKKEHMQNEDITSQLVLTDKKQLLAFKGILEAADWDKYINLIKEEIKKNTASDLMSSLEPALKEYKENNTLVGLEGFLKLNLLYKTKLLSHKYALSLNTILSYIFAKEIEVKNLLSIYKGKVLSMNENKIKQLVIA